MERTKVSPRHYLAAALFGLGLAIIAYRVLALWFHDRSLLTWFMPAVGGACAVGALQLSRSASGPTGSSALKFVIGVAAFLPALLVMKHVIPPVHEIDRIAWTVRQGPGFEISMPASDDVTRETSNFASGKIVEKNIGDQEAYAAVEWSVGLGAGADNDAILEAAIRAAGGTRAPFAPTVLDESGAPVSTVATSVLDDHEVWLSILSCSQRNMIISSAAKSSSIKTLHTRLVHSFHCTTDQPPAESLGRVHLMIELPSFTALSKQTGQLQLQDGNRVVVLQEMTSDTSIDADAVKAILSVSASNVEVDPEIEGRFPFRANYDADTQSHGWLAVQHCIGEDVMVLATASTDASLDDVADAYRNARCTEPGEEPRDWPTAEELATKDADLAKVHLSIKLPDYDVYARTTDGFSLASREAAVTVEEVSSDIEWSADSVAERVLDAGRKGKLGKRLADGRWPFTTTAADDRPGDVGWVGAKVCGDHQIVVIAATSTKHAQKQVLGAFRAARCTDELTAY